MFTCTFCGYSSFTNNNIHACNVQSQAGCGCDITIRAIGSDFRNYCIKHSKDGVQIESTDAKAQHTPEIEKSTMEVGGTKYDQEKPRMDLLSSEALVQIAQVLTFGAKKYESHNWRKGIAWSRVLGAAMRHLTAFNGGEDKDPETGLSHLAHLGCCVMFLLEYEKTHKELDDRFNVEPK